MTIGPVLAIAFAVWAAPVTRLWLSGMTFLRVPGSLKVAVLDCGIHASHPDLAGKVVLERNFTGSSTTDDRCNHGTHVAGTIGAVTNNAGGVAAVAPGDAAQWQGAR
jgi:hypothetical protein